MRTEVRMPWIAVFAVPPAPAALQRPGKYHGDGRDILLQGFHWHSHRGGLDEQARTSRPWYRVLADNAPAIRSAGFTWVWFPPASDSLAPEGYIPRRWHVFDSAFGSEAELRTAIRSLEPVKALADIVVNHRVGVATAGADFEDPPFPDNHAAITRDDDSGIGTGNPDTGENYAAGRDLDHTNPEVRAAVVEYQRRLQGLGFRGWRYDLVKGYHGRYVAEYNDATQPEFSVGEFFDGDRQKVTDWLDAAAGKSTAFDFPTRYLLHEACRDDDYSRLRSFSTGRSTPGGLIGFWPSRSVTFVDNHDTEHRRDEEHRRNNNDTRHFAGPTVDMAYAYILTHPGVPCVFWPHYFDWGAATRQRIDRLIKVRKHAGVYAQSNVDIREAKQGLYAATIDGRLAVKLGAQDWWPGGGWQVVADGERFAVWVRS